MTKTMIQIDVKTRDKLKSLGNMGETYDDLLQRLSFMAEEYNLTKLLLDTSESRPIKEILKERNLL